MKMSEFVCENCSKSVSKPSWSVKQRIDRGQKLYCSTACFREAKKKERYKAWNNRKKLLGGSTT